MTQQQKNITNMILMDSSSFKRTLRLMIFIQLCALIFVNYGCFAQKKLNCMRLSNDSLHTLLNSIVAKELSQLNVVLLNVKNERDTVFVNLVAIDSNSVSKYLGSSIDKVTGTFVLGNRTVLIFGLSKYFFQPTTTYIGAPFLKKVNIDYKYPPVPIDAFVRTYFLQNDGHFILYPRYMSFFGK